MQKLAAHQHSPLTGRHKELHQVWNLFEASTTGHTHVVFVSGEPGIGKTQLARQFEHWARDQGALCLSAKFFDYQASRLAPFEVLLDDAGSRAPR